MILICLNRTRFPKGFHHHQEIPFERLTTRGGIQLKPGHRPRAGICYQPGELLARCFLQLCEPDWQWLRRGPIGTRIKGTSCYPGCVFNSADLESLSLWRAAELKAQKPAVRHVRSESALECVDTAVLARHR